MSKLTLCVSVFFCLLLSFNTHAADNGLFMVVKGTVKVISGKDKSTATAKVGSKVFSGDTVVTEKDSRAKIVMADRNVLQLSPDTKFEITNYKTSEVESERTAQLALMQGKVRAQVEQKYGEKNKFEMKTPTAVAGVRGTQYVVQFNPTTAMTSIMVMAGKVMVSPTGMPAAAVGVTPNQGVNVAANVTQLKTFVVSKEQMNSFSNMSETKSLDAIKQENPEAGTSKDSTKNEEGKKDEREPSSESGQERMVTSDDHGSGAMENEKNKDVPSNPERPKGPKGPDGPTDKCPGGLCIQPTPPPPPPTPVPVPTPVRSTKTKVIVTPKPQ